MADRTQLFLSYARGDDEPFVNRLYQDLIHEGYRVWWDRVSMPNRSLTFLQEIRDAVEASERLIAVVGPMAVESEYVLAEWEHADLFCKGVTPILRLGDFDLIPQELSKLHCPDFRKQRSYEEALKELFRILAEPLLPLGKFQSEVPSLPPHFFPRREEIEQLSRVILADVHRPTVITSAQRTIALQGMGGVGKSVLAAAFARTAETRRAFTDGIFWLTIGQTPDLAQVLRLIGLAFDDNPDLYLSERTARARLALVIADKVCMIILDDVWDVRHAELFTNSLGPRCRLLITTRDGTLVTDIGAQEHRLDILSNSAALHLLAERSGQAKDSLPSQALNVISECGNLPFAIALCGAMVKDGTSWTDVVEALEEADLTFFKRRFPNYPYPDIIKSIQVSIDALSREDQTAVKNYEKLAVFPFDKILPEEVVVALWMGTNGIKERHARNLVIMLGRKNLLQVEGETPNRHVTLHDLHVDYLRATQGNLACLHERLLDSFISEWSKNKRIVDYLVENLALHLKGAGRDAELQDLKYISESIDITNPDGISATNLANVQKLWYDFFTSFSNRSASLSPNILIQWILRKANVMQIERDMHYYANRVRFYNVLKKEIRTEIIQAREYLTKISQKSYNSDPVEAGFEAYSTVDYDTIPNYDENGDPNIQIINRGSVFTSAELDSYIRKLEEELSDASDEAQLANVDLQNQLQKQQIYIQHMSNLSKMLHDTALAAIRSIPPSE